MEKWREKKDPHSCLNKAGEDELIFVLRAHDIAAPFTVRQWAAHRVEIGKNEQNDREIKEALEWADRAEEARRGAIRASL